MKLYMHCAHTYACACTNHNNKEGWRLTIAAFSGVNQLPPANKVCEGYVFTGVCLSTGEGYVWQGACMLGACMAGGCAWQGGCMAGGHACWGACMAGGMHGRGMHGRGCVWCGACMAGGHAWCGGMHCRGGHAWQILRDTVNEQALRILLECILLV